MLRVLVVNAQQRIQQEHAGGPLDFGRTANLDDRRHVPRIIVNDLHVSRDHMTVQETGGGKVHVANLSRKSPVFLADGRELPVDGAGSFALPLQVTIGKTQVELSDGGSDSSDSGSLHTINQPVVQTTLRSTVEAAVLGGIGETPTPERLAEWFERVIAVQHAAAGSAEFYEETARALVELVGLDRGMVLLYRRGSEGEDLWDVAAVCSGGSADDSRIQDTGRFYSRTILRKVLGEKRTFYRTAEVNPTMSMSGVESFVASPILDVGGQVVGALYGVRSSLGGMRRLEIKPLEAQLVQLLAGAVGTGLVRLTREAEVARSRVQFEQFFSEELARELQRNPALLDGCDREVTCLFADIRNFSALSQQLGPGDTCALVGDVMDRLTQRIVERSGTLVDYSGDGLLAMWNAPADQPNHAELAADAALALQAEVPAMNAVWAARLGRPLALGIGINTGVARVGNVGSKRRFKYGPLGHHVNLASRVEGATKYLGTPTLITRATRNRLGPEFSLRRVCQAQLVGMTEPAELFELHSRGPDEVWERGRDAYERALALFESGKWSEACQAVYPSLVASHARPDVPSLMLLARAVECLRTEPDSFDPVFFFEQK